jgi:hypothetical protein
MLRQSVTCHKQVANKIQKCVPKFAKKFYKTWRCKPKTYIRNCSMLEVRTWPGKLWLGTLTGNQTGWIQNISLQHTPSVPIYKAYAIFETELWPEKIEQWYLEYVVQSLGRNGRYLYGVISPIMFPSLSAARCAFITASTFRACLVYSLVCHNYAWAKCNLPQRSG